MSPSQRTSITDALRVDWLGDPSPGRVGLTFAPGKQGSSVTGASGSAASRQTWMGCASCCKRACSAD
jgi:hypothetical protein